MANFTETPTALDRFPVGTRVHDIGPMSEFRYGTTTEGTVVCGGGRSWGPEVVMVRFDIDFENPPAPAARHYAELLRPMNPDYLGRL